MKLAFLYAGQGSQHAGMGADLYASSPVFRRVMDEAAAAVDFDLKTTCFEDPEGVINQTQYTQPCMVAFAAGVTAMLAEEGIRPEYAAGLSLGEYSALECAGVLDAKTAVELVAFRGKAMAKASEGLACGMTAVLALDRDRLQACCDEASALGVVQICNYNCPGQLVIGGQKAAVDRAAELAKEAGAKRCLPLKVSGPFHTALMHPAGVALAERFAGVNLRRCACRCCSLPGARKSAGGFHRRPAGAPGAEQRLSRGYHPPPGGARRRHGCRDRPRARHQRFLSKRRWAVP